MANQHAVEQRDRRSGDEALERRSVIARLAVAGIVGPILFMVAFVLQGSFRREEYSPVAEVVSALEAGPWGWVQQVNFAVFGVLTVAFAIGLHLGLRPTWRSGWCSSCCSPARWCSRSGCGASHWRPMGRADRPRGWLRFLSLTEGEP